MKTTLRGLVVLCLLALAPIGRAAIITHSFTANDPAGTAMSGGSVNIFLPAYDEPASLTSALFLIDLRISGMLLEFNPYDVPITLGAGLELASLAVLTDLPGANVLGVSSDSQVQSLGVFEISTDDRTFGRSYSFQQSLLIAVNDPALLALLASAPLPNILVGAKVSHGARFGDANFGAAVAIDALYNVPTSIDPLIALAIGLIALACAHRIKEARVFRR